MAKFKIYSKDGKSVRHMGEPQFNGSYMGLDYVEFRTISSPEPITWAIGDYVDYYRTGLRYKMYSLPMPNKVARRGECGASFDYSNVQFFAATKELEIAPFRDLVPEDNKIHFSTSQNFSTYEDVYGIARRIQACMDDLYPGKWKIEVVDTDDEALLSTLSEIKEFTFSGGSCIDALSQVYDLWKNVGWIHTYDSERDIDIITIGGANVRNKQNTSEVFGYGKGKGLTSIKKGSANPDEFATRLYVYGSDRNIQTRYYNQFDIVEKDSVDIRNLMLPLEKWGKTNGIPDPRKAYLQASDEVIEKYGLIPRTLYFDGSENKEIYPSIVGLTELQVRLYMIEAGLEDSPYIPSTSEDRIDRIVVAEHEMDEGDKEAVEKNRTFGIVVRKLGFDIAEQGKKTAEGHATISFKSGACAGRDFVVKSCQTYANSQYITLERTWDESVGMGYPNKYYPIRMEDEFVVLDIPMPDFYIAIAEDKLYAEAEKMLADYTRVSAFYEPNLDPIMIQSSTTVLRAGMYMAVNDADIVETDSKTDYVLVDTLTIDESAQLPLYKVTLREQKRAYRNYGALESMIEDAKLETKKDVATFKGYTERRFRSAQETMEMIQSAFKNFSEGISPVTVHTMSLLLGDQSLQFRFIASSGDSMASVNPTLEYVPELKRMISSVDVRLMHMTLNVDDVTPMSSRTIDTYKKWLMPAQSTEVIEEAEKAYYIYAQVPKLGTSGKYIFSEDVIEMDDMKFGGNYHFLVGILNTEHDGTREFVPLYGFTEILPGQISTDIIRSADGKTYFDLAGNVINVGQRTGMSGSDSQLRIWAGSAFADRNKAPFRVQDNGYMIAENAKITGEVTAESGKIGPLYISLDGLGITEFPSDMPLGSVFGALALMKDQVSFATLVKESSNSGTSIRNVLINLKSKTADTPAILISSSAAANGRNIGIKCTNGMFSGLRPMTKVITSGLSSTSRNQLTEFDFSVLVNLTSGTCYIKLPTSPLDGQEYYIESKGASINLTASQSIYSLYSGSTTSAGNAITQSGRSLLRFKYYAEINQWTVTWMNRTS